MEDTDSLIEYLEQVKESEDENIELQKNLHEVINDIKESKSIEPDLDRSAKLKETYKANSENPNIERINYKITDDNLGVGTPKERFNNNIEAIKVLKKCENENRLATKEEQNILSKYVGWGGLSNAFNIEDNNWKNEYNTLKDLLTEEEYENERASTLTAFYTPPIVIKAMYKVLENIGVKNANILEPSCGIGNFIGSVPSTINNKIYGIELDSISGRIARQLYQKENITINGFEKVDLPDSFFDIAIGNVPFGNFKVNDKKYDKNNFLIHDYFFGKTLDKVRPGGVVAFITSKGTLDKENPNVRKYIAQRADLLGAIRLPNNTFVKNAGTEVTSDIIFLQKRENMTDIMPDWVYLDTNENGIKMNKYFVDNPEMILGTIENKTTQFGLDTTCVPNHIIEQFASEFLQLYPSANILVATKKDFQTANRKKFCSRIATGDFDAVIIGHSQFEKIPMSIERQEKMLKEEINNILMGIDDIKRNNGEKFTIKQLEKTRKSLENKLESLNNQEKKDDVITFEQLGIDKLFVDEAHRI